MNNISFKRMIIVFLLIWMIGINVFISLMITRCSNVALDVNPFSDVGRLASENVSLRIEVRELYDCFHVQINETMRCNEAYSYMESLLIQYVCRYERCMLDN